MVIELRHVTREYPGGVTALRGISAALGEGVTGLLGPNGAGKTTLISLMVGLERPSTGSVTGGGLPIEKRRTHLYRRLGYLPQQFTPYPSLTVEEFLDYMALLKEVAPASVRRERIQKALAAVDMEEE